MCVLCFACFGCVLRVVSYVGCFVTCASHVALCFVCRAFACCVLSFVCCDVWCVPYMLRHGYCVVCCVQRIMFGV